MNAKEIGHNTWKVHNIGTIKYVFILAVNFSSEINWVVKIKSYNAKEICLKAFISEANARNFAERFIAMLEEQEEF